MPHSSCNWCNHKDDKDPPRFCLPVGRPRLRRQWASKHLSVRWLKSHGDPAAWGKRPEGASLRRQYLISNLQRSAPDRRQLVQSPDAGSRFPCLKNWRRPVGLELCEHKDKWEERRAERKPGARSWGNWRPHKTWLHVLLKSDLKGLRVWDQEKDTISGFKI